MEIERQLKGRLLDTLDLAVDLRGSCEEIDWALRRSHVGDDDFLGLTPGTLASVTDDDLCRLSITRATVFLEFMVAALNEEFVAAAPHQGTVLNGLRAPGPQRRPR